MGATAQGGYLLSGVEDNNLDSTKIVQVYWTGVKYAYDSKTDITLSYYRENPERLPCSVDLLARRRLPQFLLGQSERGFALYGSSFHQAIRRIRRYCVFKRQRRPGHRHSSRPRRALFLQHQSCADSRRSLHLLIIFRRGCISGLPTERH